MANRDTKYVYETQSIRLSIVSFSGKNRALFVVLSSPKEFVATYSFVLYGKLWVSKKHTLTRLTDRCKRFSIKCNSESIESGTRLNANFCTILIDVIDLQFKLSTRKRVTTNAVI